MPFFTCAEIAALPLRTNEYFATFSFHEDTGTWLGEGDFAEVSFTAQLTPSDRPTDAWRCIPGSGLAIDSEIHMTPRHDDTLVEFGIVARILGRQESAPPHAAVKLWIDDWEQWDPPSTMSTGALYVYTCFIEEAYAIDATLQPQSDEHFSQTYVYDEAASRFERPIPRNLDNESDMELFRLTILDEPVKDNYTTYVPDGPDWVYRDWTPNEKAKLDLLLDSARSAPLRSNGR